MIELETHTHRNEKKSIERVRVKKAFREHICSAMFVELLKNNPKTCLTILVLLTTLSLLFVCEKKNIKMYEKPVLNVVGSALHVSLNIYFFCIHT